MEKWHTTLLSGCPLIGSELTLNNDSYINGESHRKNTCKMALGWDFPTVLTYAMTIGSKYYRHYAGHSGSAVYRHYKVFRGKNSDYEGTTLLNKRLMKKTKIKKEKKKWV
jgi:hypothetical protein